MRVCGKSIGFSPSTFARSNSRSIMLKSSRSTIVRALGWLVLVLWYFLAIEGRSKNADAFGFYVDRECGRQQLERARTSSTRTGGDFLRIKKRLLHCPSHEASGSRIGRTHALRSTGGALGVPESSPVHPKEQQHSPIPIISKIRNFTTKNFFLVGMFVAVGLARAFPAAGKNGGVLRPELFIGNYGVTTIFLLSGLSLELAQLREAALNWKLNALIQTATFVAWPFLIGVPLSNMLARLSFFPQPLLDGLLILSCLPTTVNMCVILTANAGGNMASALCNAVISNLMGIFATPALLFRFFGADIQLPFLDMLIKLSAKVLLPVAVGQALRATPAKEFYQKHSNFFKRLQELILLSILWNAFCSAISSNMGLGVRDGLALLALLPAIHLFTLGALFLFFSRIARFGPAEVVAAMFCSSQKTLAFGLPLINTIFEGSGNLAAYCAPLMFIHPIQLIIGSSLIPMLQRYTSTARSDDAS